MMRPYYDYSRPRRFAFGRSLARATRAIIVVTIAAAVLELLLWNVAGTAGEGQASWWEREVFLTPRRAVEDGRPWQFVTHLLVQLPGAWFTLLGTVLILYVFGSDLERHLGPRRFVLFYVACGLGGGLAALVWYDRPVAGAMAAVLGVATACALMWPDRPLQIVVPVRTKWVVLVLVVVPALAEAATAAGRGNVPHLPELGGPAVALLVWALTRFAVRPSAQEAVTDRPADSPDRRRVDDILEKVHSQGVGSLTRRERRILEEASAELRRRGRRGDQPPAP